MKTWGGLQAAAGPLASLCSAFPDRHAKAGQGAGCGPGGPPHIYRGADPSFWFSLRPLPDGRGSVLSQGKPVPHVSPPSRLQGGPATLAGGRRWIMDGRKQVQPMLVKSLLAVLLLAGFAGAAPAPEENWERLPDG